MRIMLGSNGWRRTAAIVVLGLSFVVDPALGSGKRSIPWGAMYVPIAEAVDHAMTGTVAAYRGRSGAERLLVDLPAARASGIRLIVTLGAVAPAEYMTGDGHIDPDSVDRELEPFFAIAGEIRPYIEDGTVWGVRFLDEPHDPAGCPRGFEVDPVELGTVYASIHRHLGGVPIGSTAPPAYMLRVPGAGIAFGQVVHARLPAGFDDPTQFHTAQSRLAHDHGLLYVASVNANTNPIDSATFFRTYREMCAIETVDFATAWQWPQGHHPEASFEARFLDPDPAVQAEIARIPEACAR